jgi:transposase
VKDARKPMEIKREDLERLLEHARPSLTPAEYEQLKAALDTLVYLAHLVGKKNTTIRRLREILFGASSEKTADVLKSLVGTNQAAGQEGAPAEERATPRAQADKDMASGEEQPAARPGHGRNGAKDYPGAQRVAVEHPALRSGERCPECRRGKLYEMQPEVLVRFSGQAPVGGTVYELKRLRCNLCLEVFNTPPPQGVGPQKYDAGTASMIALLKYGSGVPFYRLAGLQHSLGIPLPASTQWEIVENTAVLVKPALEEFIRQAAQGELFYNDDTSMKILAHMVKAQPSEDAADPQPKRTGMFTSGIVSQREGRTIALFFTGKAHAGENLAQVLAQRAADLHPPIQMCDALSRNTPQAFQTILAHCNAHARRKYVEVAARFPQPCRFVLETLAQVYRNDALCKERDLSAAQRLIFHQTHSEALMSKLKDWMSDQIHQRKVEPNCGLGEAIAYMNKHWKELTLFLRQAGAPLDNNLCEQSLKRAIVHRKNALFYKTDKGAEVGDTFMSLIHTCVLMGVNAFDYLTTVQRHAPALSHNPGQWMPWNYRDTLAALEPSAC